MAYYQSGLEQDCEIKTMATTNGIIAMTVLSVMPPDYTQGSGSKPKKKGKDEIEPVFEIYFVLATRKVASTSEQQLMIT